MDFPYCRKLPLALRMNGHFGRYHCRCPKCSFHTSHTFLIINYVDVCGAGVDGQERPCIERIAHATIHWLTLRWHKTISAQNFCREWKRNFVIAIQQVWREQTRRPVYISSSSTPFVHSTKNISLSVYAYIFHINIIVKCHKTKFVVLKVSR